jgi:rare lipoprotein A
MASCYGREHGQTRTATGAAYDPLRLTAAHRSLPFGTQVLVTNPHNRRSVIVTINDRGPAAWTHRAIDLSLGACRTIGNSGLARVFLQIVGGPHETRSRDRYSRHARRRG